MAAAESATATLVVKPSPSVRLSGLSIDELSFGAGPVDGDQDPDLESLHCNELF